MIIQHHHTTVTTTHQHLIPLYSYNSIRSLQLSINTDITLFNAVPTLLQHNTSQHTINTKHKNNIDALYNTISINNTCTQQLLWRNIWHSY